MKQSVIIDFILGYDDEVKYYFEIQNSNSEYPSIFLCEVVDQEEINPYATIIKKVCISSNDRYADWLKYNSGIYHINQYESDTILHHMYKNKHWFISLEHTNGVDKYIKELDFHFKELTGE